MLSRSATSEPLAHYSHDRISPSSSDDKCSNHLRPLPLPVMSRTSSRASSYCSTSPLNSDHEPRKGRESIAQKLLFGWKRRCEKHADLDAQYPGQPNEKSSGSKAPKLRVWHGWRLIIFDSCTNAFAYACVCILTTLLPVQGSTYYFCAYRSL